MILVLLIVLILMTTTTIEGFTELEGWHQDPNCNYAQVKVLDTFLKHNRILQNTHTNWKLYLPCGYNNAETEFTQIRSNNSQQCIYIVNGCDQLSRKDTLWTHLYSYYGAAATKYMPMTYVLYSKNTLQQDYDPKHTYILKKNIQRQQGLMLTRDLKTMLNGVNEGYVVAQRVLQDPFLIDGRKTNCRCYLVVTCKGDTKVGYLYNNGFMYYTPKEFQKDTLEYDRVITAGLATKRRDNDFYQTHPMTMRESTLGTPEMFWRIGKLLGAVLTATQRVLGEGDHLRNNTKFQLFGCDIAFNNKLVPQLMEINKGPDLSSATRKEEILKETLMQLMFQTVGVVPIINTAQDKLLRIWSTNT